MKYLIALTVMLSAALAYAAEPPTRAPTNVVVKGKVLEVQDVETYTYLRLKTKDGETWAAVSKTPIKKGAEVVIENTMMMENFESKSLKKTFPKIVFGTLAGSAARAAETADMKAAHANLGVPAEVGDVNVPKATGPGARTVAEIVTKRVELKNKPVLVSGKVVKYNGGVMGKNWLHLRDGTGKAADNSNDVVVTTMDKAKVGEIVTVKGIVHTDIDLGSGYFYKVLVEEATLQR